jgi:hypothetical protein
MITNAEELNSYFHALDHILTDYTYSFLLHVLLLITLVALTPSEYTYSFLLQGYHLYTTAELDALIHRVQ